MMVVYSAGGAKIPNNPLLVFPPQGILLPLLLDMPTDVPPKQMALWNVGDAISFKSPLLLQKVLQKYLWVTSTVVAYKPMVL
jgi:hypothetical protein